MTEKLFKKTPFNGYKREDVLQYLAEADQKQKEVVSDYEEQLEALKESAGKGLSEQLKEESDRLTEKRNALAKQLEEKENQEAALLEELEALKNTVETLRAESVETEEFSGEEPKRNEALRAAEETLSEKERELASVKESLSSLRETRADAEKDAIEVVSLQIRFAKLKGEIDQCRIFEEQLHEIQISDPEKEELRAKNEALEQTVAEYIRQIEEIKSEQEVSFEAKHLLIETETRALTAEADRTAAEERILLLEKQIEEKDEKIQRIEAAWEDSKRKFLLMQKKSEISADILNNARVKADEIVAEAEKERGVRVEAINAEIKNILSGAFKESERIIAAANEKAEVIVKNANLSAAEAMRKITPMKESLASLLSAISDAEDPEKESSEEQ